MATWTSFGKITVAASGTPQRITANRSDPTTRFACHAIMIQAIPGNVGYLVVGDSNLVRASTFAHALAIIAIPTANVIQSANAAMADVPNGLNAADFYVDANSSGDSFIVSVLEA